MFSYQHRYHAGNFADVHKHIVLIALLNALRKKETPFGVLDSHAGEGITPLNSAESKKNKEYQQGFLPLLSQPKLSPLVQQYIQIIRNVNPDPAQLVYPGSPKIISHFLRENDTAILIEGHQQAIVPLRAHFRKEARIKVHERDAMEGLLALLPLKEKRGLVFIDPSYEVKTEYTQIPYTVGKVYPHFRQGIYAIWYPILAAENHLKLIRAIQKGGFEKIWQCEWFPQGKMKAEGLRGSGLLILNLPWQVDQILTQTFRALNRTVFLGGHFQSNNLPCRPPR